MLDMLEKNFSTLRINDTIRNAESYYNTQIDLKKKNRNYDFSKIKDYCNQVINIQKNATDARDQVDAFMKFYDDSAIKGMNTSSIDAIVKDINLELADERYEQVPPLVDKAYNELSNVRASYTALNVFYKNTATGLKVFFLNNWKAITILVVLAVVLFFIYRIRIVKWLLNRKIESLETRKKVVKELIMKAQKDYFQSGTLAEGDYNIKTKKFAEIIRDIDRQMPLLKEELAKLNKQWKT
jgi:hypothetical protein